MKLWRSIIGLTLAATTILALPVMAGAAEATPSDETVSQLAYRSLDSAQSFQEMEAIVAARNSIIFGDQAWTVDGAVHKFNVDTGEVEALPDFYDLFPADWTVPVQVRRSPLCRLSAPPLRPRPAAVIPSIIAPLG